MKFVGLIASTLLIVLISQHSSTALPINESATEEPCLEGFKRVDGRCVEIKSELHSDQVESSSPLNESVTLSDSKARLQSDKPERFGACPGGMVRSENGICEEVISHDQPAITIEPEKGHEELLEVTDKPSPVTVQPIDATSEPLEVTEEPVNVTHEPLEVTEKLSKVNRKPSKVTGEPLDVTVEPLKVTEEPSDVTAEPLKVTEKMSKVYRQPLKTTEEPLDVTTEPLEVTEEPLGVTGEPSEVNRKPSKVTDEPLDVTVEPLEVTEEPLAVTGEPLKVTEKLSKVNRKPLKVTDEPLDVTGEPLEVTEEPLDVTDEPLKVTEKPSKVNRKPLKIIEKPLDVTGEPLEVTSEKSDVDDDEEGKDTIRKSGPVEVPKGCPPGTKADGDGACQDIKETSTKKTLTDLKVFLNKDGSCPENMKRINGRCMYVRSKFMAKTNQNFATVNGDDWAASRTRVAGDKNGEYQLVAVLPDNSCPSGTEYSEYGLCRKHIRPSSLNTFEMTKPECPKDEVFVGGRCIPKKVEVLLPSDVTTKVSKSSTTAPETENSEDDEPSRSKTKLAVMKNTSMEE